MLTIGTAGHIDHGKSSLVRALTSIDPDRLPEEKKRGMTIDLGFAWLPLPSGETIGIVDVPGHKQFIHNVIPGLIGVDAALLVIAADDGWMPQTEEHVQILDMLGVKHGIVALNKIDLVDDPEWLAMVERDIVDKLDKTTLKDAPVIRVSSKDGRGIPEMKEAINRLAQKLAPRQDIGKPRLPVDRVFTIKGSGVVVTGTLVNGCFSTGDDVFICPQGFEAHIRAIESYKQMAGRAQPGSRVALNLTGVKKEEISRGDVVVTTKAGASLTVNVELRLIERLENPVKNNSELVVFTETRQSLGRVIFFDKKSLGSRRPTLAQIRFNRKVPAYIGERFIVRRQSPALTIGGGVVLDSMAAKYRAKDAAETTAFLERRKNLGLDELILTEVEKYRYVERKQFLLNSLYPADEIEERTGVLSSQNRLATVGSHIVDSSYWQQQAGRVLDLLSAEHKAHPLKSGLPRALLQSQIDLPKDAFNRLIVFLVDTGEIVRIEDSIALSSHKPRASSGQEEMITAIKELFRKNCNSPPTVKEISARVGGDQDIIRFMCRQGMLVELPDGVLFEKGCYKEIEEKIVDFMKKNGQISIQDVNSLFGLSRKYVIPLLTYLDNQKITRRRENIRVLVNNQPD